MKTDKPPCTHQRASRGKKLSTTTAAKKLAPPHKHPAQASLDPVFPLHPLDDNLANCIIRDFCADMAPRRFQESGCAVCGELKSVSELSPLKNVKNLLGILEAPGVTRVEHKALSNAIREFKGPVLDYKCNKICKLCRESI